MMSRLRMKLAGSCTLLGVLLFAPFASAGGRPKHPYRYSVVDMPISLSEGTIERLSSLPPRTGTGSWFKLRSLSICANAVHDGNYCRAARIQGLH